MKKFSPIAAVTALAAALVVGVMAEHKWPTAEPAETAKLVTGPASAPAAVSRLKSDSIGIPSGDFDPQ